MGPGSTLRDAMAHLPSRHHTTVLACLRHAAWDTLGPESFEGSTSWGVEEWKDITHAAQRKKQESLVLQEQVKALHRAETGMNSKVVGLQPLVVCRRCKSTDVVSDTGTQARSADEAMTYTFSCKKCGSIWRV